LVASGLRSFAGCWLPKCIVFRVYLPKSKCHSVPLLAAADAAVLTCCLSGRQGGLAIASLEHEGP